MSDSAFREARWRRAAATDRQLAARRRQHDRMTLEERAAEAARIDGISDVDLAAELTAKRGGKPDDGDDSDGDDGGDEAGA